MAYSKRRILPTVLESSTEHLLNEPTPEFDNKAGVSSASPDFHRSDFEEDIEVTLPTPTPSFARLTSISYSLAQAQWEVLMRKFSRDCDLRDRCNVTKSCPKEMVCDKLPLKTFITGSSYEGSWNDLGMSGYGKYTFPSGAVYEGQFEDNMFHGEGELTYPNGVCITGKWNNGELGEHNLIFPDGIQYKKEDWEYCHSPDDRRYSRELNDGIEPPCNSYITNVQPPPEIPPGTYDTGEGFYEPKTCCVFQYGDPTHLLRDIRQENKEGSTLGSWIEKNCRKHSDEPVGPQPDLYKTWNQPQLKLEKGVVKKTRKPEFHTEEEESDPPSSTESTCKVNIKLKMDEGQDDIDAIIRQPSSMLGVQVAKGFSQLDN